MLNIVLTFITHKKQIRKELHYTHIRFTTSVLESLGIVKKQENNIWPVSVTLSSVIFCRGNDKVVRGNQPEQIIDTKCVN